MQPPPDLARLVFTLVPRTRSGESEGMPKGPKHDKLKRCVGHLQAKGHSTSSSWAICQASLKSDGEDDGTDELTDQELQDVESAAAKYAEEHPGVAAQKGHVVALKLSPERREATGVVAQPFDGTAGSLDLDGEALSAEDVLELARSYMLGQKLTEHDDEHDRVSDVGSLVEMFVNDDRIGSPLYPVGALVATIKYTPEEWKLVKAGKRTGFSFDADVLPEIRTVELLVPAGQVRAAGATR